MAYALRYYKEIPQEDGSIIRLEIHKKDSTTAAMEIGGVLRGLTLEIQGQQDEIDSPIVKTSLSMSFVDASDIQNDKKNGFWQEFYTPDALLWRVILKAKNAQETAFRTIWGGYVTPDSYSETLNYRGSVTIIARDNIGHLQDFPFDAQGDEDGMISLFDLVSAGWAKIQSPMDLSWNGLDWLSCNDVIAYHTLMNVEHFKDMDWYTAIEEALASYGGVMRYVGSNEVIVTTLRKLPHYGGNIDKLPHIEPVFVTGATRELIPAAKRIEESASYDLQDAVQPLVKVSDFSGNVHDASVGGFTAPVWSLTNQSKSGWSNTIPANAMYFNASAYEIQEIPFLPAYEISKKEIQESMWLLCDGKNVRAEYSRVVNPVDLSIKLQLGETINLYGGVPTGQDLFIVNAPTKVYRIKYAIAVESDGITTYLDAEGKWSSSLVELEAYDGGNDIRSLDVQIPMSEYGHNVILTFIITGIETAVGGLEETYIQVQSLLFGLADTKSYCENNAVNTNYAQENNVTLFRDPKIAPALNVVALPAFIKNGIFYRSGDEILPARLWSWGGSEQQMAVWNHLQLLCYYAKPNNLISGTIVNADITRVAAIYEWNHAEHILVSGRYNFLNGHIEGAVLREFARYEDMWSEVAGAAMPETEQDSRSNVEGGASSSASPSTYTATQNVNIGIGGGGGGTGASNLNDLQDVDTTGVVAQSVLYYNGTSWVDMSFASLVNPLLNPYLKADVAEITYAKKDALNGLETAISANTTAITGLGTRMTNAENAIGLRYTKQETNNLLAKYLLLESANQTIKGNITIEGNLIVRGDTSSTARGTDAGVAGTLLGIKVNGQTYDNPVNGILTIPDYPTSLEWSAINGKPTKLTEFTNDAGFITSAALNGYAKTADLPTKSSLGLGNVENKSSATIRGEITSSNVTNALGYTPANNASLADYLPLSGGKLSSEVLTDVLTLNSNVANAGTYLRLEYLGSKVAEFGHGWGLGTYMWCNSHNLRITSDGTAYADSNTLIHSGNIGSYAALYNEYIFGNNSVNALGYSYAANSGLTQAGPTMVFGKGNYRAYLFGRNGVLRFNTMDNGTLTGWKSIAFTDSNVASATKLQTARTIWGQSFDGTGNVSGALSNVGAITRSFQYAVDADQAGNLTFKTNVTEWKFNNSAGTTIVAVNGASNNVGVGTNNPAYKLDVNGRASFGEGGARVVVGHLGNTIDSYVNGSFSGKLHINNTSSGNIQMCMGGGNVLIGTSTDSGYKLDIAGNEEVLNVSNPTGGNVGIRFSRSTNTSWSIKVAGGNLYINENNSGTTRAIFYESSHGGSLALTGNLVVAGDTSSGSDIRFKDKLSDHRIAISDIADAPLFTFRWNDRDDDSVHLGSSAQYWEKVAPWLVKGEDFKTLDYSTLGVAIGISLANKAVNHEERIKILEKENKALKEQIRRIQYGS